ncbi:MAG: branched-chain amino acid ABC transporter permease [Candidatus Methylomirabilales bacterium]
MAMKSPGTRRALVFAGTAGLALLFPLLLPPYPLIILCYALVFSIACLGLNLLLGTTGLLSFGHAAYFGVGAYAGAFLYRFSGVSSFEVYLLAGIFFSTVLAAVIGFLCVRATKIHFAILTLAFAMVVHSLFIDGAIFRLFGPLGWALYLVGGGGLYIPRLTLLGTEFTPAQFIPVFYYVIVVAFFGSAILLWRISRSPFGKALRAIRDNDTRAAFIGIPVRRYRWYAFILSGIFTGLAGGLYGQLSRQITPEQLHWLFSAQLVLATVLGGTHQFLGPVVGAFAFVALEDISVRFTLYRGLILGCMLIAVVLALPGGLAGAVVLFLNKIRTRGDPKPDATESR